MATPSASLALTGRRILLTGPTGHLGRAMAQAIAEAGGTVILAARRPDAAEALAESLPIRGQVMPFDLANLNRVPEAVAALGSAPIHGIVNNAYGGRGGTLATATPEDFAQSFAYTVTAAQALVQAALPQLRAAAIEQSGGAGASIVNISSMYGLVSPDPRVYASPEGTNPPFYGAAKGALLQWTRYAACELAPQGIRVNALTPGPFPSPKAQESDPALIANLTGRVPLGRIGVPLDIGGPVVFLLSPAAAYITGATLPVDGGWTAW